MDTVFSPLMLTDRKARQIIYTRNICTDCGIIGGGVQSGSYFEVWAVVKSLTLLEIVASFLVMYFFLKFLIGVLISTRISTIVNEEQVIRLYVSLP